MGNTKGRHAVIFLSAPETQYGYIQTFLEAQPDASIVCADGGLRHAQAMGLLPNLLIGDFDSSDRGAAREVIRLKPEKDDTDAQACVRELLRRDYKEMTLVCATGGRLDHLLANLSLLEEAMAGGAKCALLDAQNYVVLHPGGRQQFKKNKAYRYFSIVPLDAQLYGVTIAGAKYPLQDATVTRAGMITISNEAVADQMTIAIAQGTALVVFANDR